MKAGWVIPIDWTTFGPATFVASGALLALGADLIIPHRSGRTVRWLASGIPSAAGIGGALVALHRTRVGGDVWTAHGFSVVILAVAALVVVGSVLLIGENAMPLGEFQFLLGSSAAGGLVMVGASDLVTLVVGIELLALPSIALVGLRRGDRRAISTAWTFFLTSVVSSAIAVMGIALIYGLTGTLSYSDLHTDLANDPRPAVAVAVVLTVIGLLFKIGSVPFHTWVPDAYRGASPVVTAFLSSVSKVATLGALVWLLVIGLGSAESSWWPAVAFVAAVTMTLGNVGALRQYDGVAVLAWSSIAQAGFLLVPLGPIVAGDWRFFSAPLQYVAVYALANVVGFLALAVVLKVRGSTTYGDLEGLARTDPWVGLPLAFAVLTLAGFPPAIVGLVTKYIVFQPVVSEGPMWLAIVMAINVMLGLAYYLRLVAVLFVAAPSAHRSIDAPLAVRFATIVVVVGGLALAALSLWPGPLLDDLTVHLTGS